ncbi:flagellar hook-length control protein FliK [Lachnospiraceae bacterium 46-61]
MDTSIKFNDFVAMQGQVMTTKVNGSDYKNDAFYGFMQQTAETQKTSNQNSAKKNTSSKDTPKNDAVNKDEDVTKPETQQKEDVTENDTKDVKEDMIQQVDLAMFAAAVNVNIVPAENIVSETVSEDPILQTEVTQVQTNMNVNADANTTEQNVQVADTMQQQGNESKVEQTTQQTAQTEEIVSEQKPNEIQTEKVVEMQPKQEQVKQTETTKVETKTEAVKTTAEETNVIEQTVETETKSDTAQTNTSEEDTDLFEKEISTTSKKTFSEDVINIKVGENAQIADAEMAQKVSDKMLAKFAQHENEFEIQLTPKELGKIVIKLVMENGQAHVSMFAENAKTSNLLAEKAREISSIIEQNTGNKTDVIVVDKQEMEAQYQNKEGKGEGFTRQQEEQQRQHQQRLQQEQSRDFIQQMRLGLWNEVS